MLERLKVSLPVGCGAGAGLLFSEFFRQEPASFFVAEVIYFQGLGEAQDVHILLGCHW